MRYIRVFKSPYITAKGGAISLISISESTVVTVISSFESVFRKSDVGFFSMIVMTRHSSLANNSFSKTFARYRAILWRSTVAFFFVLLSAFLFFLLFENLFVVRSDDGLYIGHAAITKFNVVSVEDLSELVARWKTAVHQLEEAFANVSGDVGAVRGIKPNNVSFPFPLMIVLECGRVELEFMIIATLAQSFLVWWYGSKLNILL